MQTPSRIVMLCYSFAAAVVFLLVASVLLTDGNAGQILLDRQPRITVYPFTIQNLMWVIFFLGLGELYLRIKSAHREAAQLHLALLPEDSSTLLRAQDLGQLYQDLGPDSQRYFLQRMIRRCILQFQSSASIDQTNSLLNSSLELFQHEIDLRYNMLRYVVWLIPTLGFIGTVVGIALALHDAGTAADPTDPALLGVLTGSLAVAFYTTLVALVLSAILVFVMHIAQEREELALNKVGQYCLDNLIIRLYEK